MASNFLISAIVLALVLAAVSKSRKYGPFVHRLSICSLLLCGCLIVCMISPFFASLLNIRPALCLPLCLPALSTLLSTLEFLLRFYLSFFVFVYLILYLSFVSISTSFCTICLLPLCLPLSLSQYSSRFQLLYHYSSQFLVWFSHMNVLIYLLLCLVCLPLCPTSSVPLIDLPIFSFLYARVFLFQGTLPSLWSVEPGAGFSCLSYEFPFSRL